MVIAAPVIDQPLMRVAGADRLHRTEEHRVRAHLRLAYVRREIEAASSRADREQILMDELRWLAPSG